MSTPCTSRSPLISALPMPMQARTQGWPLPEVGGHARMLGCSRFAPQVNDMTVAIHAGETRMPR